MSYQFLAGIGTASEGQSLEVVDQLPIYGFYIFKHGEER